MADEKYPRQGDHMTNDETELRPSHSTCMECGAVVGTNSNCENCRRMATRNWPSRHLWGTDGTCLNCGKMEDRANEQCIPVANGDKGLAEIKTKCEQYWNEHRIGSVEVHAILEFIHTRTVDVIAKVERLEADIRELQDHSAARERTYNLLTTALEGYKAKVERLDAEALLHKTFGIDQRKSGMEAAAKWMKRRGIHPYTVREFREWAAANKQTGEADSRELLAPATPSPGSASPVDSPEQT